MTPQSPAKHPLEGILVCPTTGEALKRADGVWRSSKRAQFPQTNGITWLYRNPEAAMNHWRKKIQDVLLYSQQVIERVQESSTRENLLRSTRVRLENLNEGHQKNITCLRVLLGDLAEGDVEGDLAALERVPKQQAAMAYQQTLFRDWAWGQPQNKEYAELLLPALAGKKKLAFLGAGACGLPLTVHNQIRPDFSLAVDINPILLITARQLLQGKTVKLVEFPVVPSDSSRVCLEHNLKMDSTAAPNFETLFCDAQNLPVEDKSLDAVVTSWFIDIVPCDLRDLAKSINAVLENNGVWSNIGQLGFDKNDLAQVYRHEEIKEILEEAGFEIQSWEIRDLPYLHSPNDALGRTDKILVFAAAKKSHAKRPARHEYWPEWITNPALPVPLTEEFRSFRIRSSVYTFVSDQVDGKKSLREIAAIVAREFGLSLAEAEKAVHNFFSNYYEGVVYREF